MTHQLNLFSIPTKPKPIKWWGKGGWFARECREMCGGDRSGDWRKYWAYLQARDRYIHKTIGPDRYLNDGSVPRFDETEEGRKLLKA